VNVGVGVSDGVRVSDGVLVGVSVSVGVSVMDGVRVGVALRMSVGALDGSVAVGIVSVGVGVSVSLNGSGIVVAPGMIIAVSPAAGDAVTPLDASPGMLLGMPSRRGIVSILAGVDVSVAGAGDAMGVKLGG
jgi:hypothetical protein